MMMRATEGNVVVVAVAAASVVASINTSPSAC